jgi:hypothetical protein
MSWGSRLVLGVGLALVVAVQAAGAKPTAAPRVTGTSKPPLVAARGDLLKVSATVVGTGRVGLVLGTLSGSSAGGISLGKGVAVGHGGKRVLVTGRVPKSVATGVLHTLLVCALPKGACRKAARIATSGTTTEERLEGARQAGRITAKSMLVYGLLALRPNKALPPELRGGSNGPSGEQAPIQDALTSFSSLSAAAQKQVFPFFVPPRAKGSAWAPPAKRLASTAEVDCRFYRNLDPGGNGWDWRGVPTADGKAIIWYVARTNPRWHDVEAQERAAAYRYARELPKIWKKLTPAFREPKSDAGEPCFHGPDGRLDIYIDDDVVFYAGGLKPGTLAVAVPYPRSGNPCADHAAWIAIRGSVPNWGLAHEFMHAIQFAYPTAQCDPDPAWWNEGQASWAADYVYPDDQYEQREFPQLVTEPLGYELTNSSYASWPFWMMVQRTQNVGVLRSILTGLQTKSAEDAVDSAISGGFARQLPRFFLHAYNKSPVGDAGFEIPASFKAWDKWSASPDTGSPTDVTLGGFPEKIFVLKSAAMTFPRRSLAGYQRITISDSTVKQLKFTNDLAGKPGAHVDAMLHLASGSWKVADWTGKSEVTLCRDKADQNVTEIVVVNTNTGKSALAPFAHKLRAKPSCGPHYYRMVAATLQETFTGSMDFSPPCPPFSGTQTNTMSLSNVFGPGNNQLFELGGALIGQLGALGTKTGSSTMHGCDLTTGTACTKTGSGALTGGVLVNVNIAPGSQTAQLQWTLTDPTVGLGFEGAGTPCFISPIAWTIDDQSIGAKTVSADVFEADTPQTISIAVDFDLTGPQNTQLHASENYLLTIQRVNADGSTL